MFEEKSVVSTLSQGLEAPGFFALGVSDPRVLGSRGSGLRVCDSESMTDVYREESNGVTFRISETLAECLRPDVSRKNERDDRGCRTGGRFIEAIDDAKANAYSGVPVRGHRPTPVSWVRSR